MMNSLSFLFINNENVSHIYGDGYVNYHYNSNVFCIIQDGDILYYRSHKKLITTNNDITKFIKQQALKVANEGSIK